MRSTGDATPTGHPLRTLLLEDNRVDARLTQEGLRDCDDRIDCDIASSLREVSAQRLATVDCAVIDLSLPDASGLQALDRIHDIAPHIPIVVLTGFDDGATGVAALRRGAQDYMLKQHADGSAIARAIRFAIERKRQARRDLDRQCDVVERLDEIGMAMRTTQRRSTEHPELADRITDHLNELQQVIDQIRGTFTPCEVAPDDGPLVW
jgi:DNA-binding NarL/FixJ family response regulator